MNEISSNVNRKNDKYESILHAAFETFMEKGFHDTKMEEIAQKAGIGKGTIYEYFTSKKDLFCGMVKSIMTWYCNSLETAIINGKDFNDKIDNMMKLHMEFAAQANNLLKVMTHNFVHISSELNRWMMDIRRKMISMVEEVFCQGIREGKIRQVDVHLVALLFMASWKEIMFEEIIGESHDKSLEEIKDEALGILLNGIALRNI